MDVPLIYAIEKLDVYEHAHTIEWNNLIILLLEVNNREFLNNESIIIHNRLWKYASNSEISQDCQRNNKAIERRMTY